MIPSFSMVNESKNQTENLEQTSWNSGSIVLGTVFNIFHSEFETDEDFFARVDHDLPAIKAASIGQVMIFPMNQWDPETRSLEWGRTDYLIRKIESLDLKFIPLMLKEEQCSHYFPIWKHHELETIWAQHYSECGNRNTREHVDFADPLVFPEVEKYFKAVIERYGNSPALSFYNVWNEPHYNHQSEHVIARFRAWLKKKYGTLATLRRVWAEDYTNWEEVSPFVNDNWDSDMPAIDWILFRNELNGHLLKELTHLLRRYDKNHPVNANPVGTTWSRFGNFGFYNTDNWQFTPHQDICGLSYYPDDWDRSNYPAPHPVWLHNLTFSIVRSASNDKDYILSEIYTNAQNGLTLGGWLKPERLENLAWLTLANDCKGIIYWKWLPFYRGRQSLGRGLCYVDGSLSPRGEAVRNLGRAINRWGDLLYQAHPAPSQVAVLLDMNGLLKNLEASDPRTRSFMYESNAGVFRALDEANITVDFLRMDLGLTAEQLRQYKVLILPFQLVMRESVASLLRAYVEQGGTLIADCRTATLDENDFAFKNSPGFGLDEIFGARRIDWEAQDAFFPVKWVESDDPPVNSLAARYFREKLEVYPGTDILAVFDDNSGDAALLRNKFGRGQACLAAFSLGGSYHATPDGEMGRVVLDLVNRAGVSNEFSWSSPDQIMIRLHEHPEGKLLYLINPQEKLVSGRLQVKLEKGYWEQQILIPDSGEKISCNSNPLLQMEFKALEVKVYIFRRL